MDFSGDCREWQTVGEALSDYPRLYLDLPGHGRWSASMAVTGFEEMMTCLPEPLLVTTYLTTGWWVPLAAALRCFMPARSCGALRHFIVKADIRA